MEAGGKALADRLGIASDMPTFVCFVMNNGATQPVRSTSMQPQQWRRQQQQQRSSSSGGGSSSSAAVAAQQRRRRQQHQPDAKHADCPCLSPSLCCPPSPPPITKQQQQQQQQQQEQQQLQHHTRRPAAPPSTFPPPEDDDDDDDCLSRHSSSRNDVISCASSLIWVISRGSGPPGCRCCLPRIAPYLDRAYTHHPTSMANKGKDGVGCARKRTQARKVCAHARTCSHERHRHSL